MVIKPSGVGYDELTADAWSSATCDGDLVEGELAPVPRHRGARLRLPAHAARSAASCTPTPPTPRAWAARGEPIPCVLTMMADEFGGDIPVGPFALIGDDSIGRGHRRDAARAAARRRC